MVESVAEIQIPLDLLSRFRSCLPRITSSASKTSEKNASPELPAKLRSRCLEFLEATEKYDQEFRDVMNAHRNWFKQGKVPFDEFLFGLLESKETSYAVKNLVTRFLLDDGKLFEHRFHILFSEENLQQTKNILKDSSRASWLKSLQNLGLSSTAIKELAKILCETFGEAARSRWKIENECFNTLKNSGYEMEHNYGHGEEYLAANYFLLTLLSHLFHQIHQLVDEVYQKLRAKKGSLIVFWNDLKAAIKMMIFDSWDQLISYLLDPPRVYASQLMQN